MRTSISILTFKYKKMKQLKVEENVLENVDYCGSDENNNNNFVRNAGVGYFD